MRYALAAVIITVSAIPAFAREKPTADCSADFVARWQTDKVAVVEQNQTPKKPCWMKTDTGAYVCDQDGCSRASAYFNQD